MKNLSGKKRREKPVNTRSLYGKLSYLRSVFLLFLIYFITALFGLQLDAVSGFATLVWIPTGLSLASLLLFGIRLWPAIALGAFTANYLNGASTEIALGITVGNTLESIIGAHILKRFLSFNPNLERLKDAFGLILIGAMASTSISATIGVTSLIFGRAIESASILHTWIAWWVGDMMSVLILTPFLLTWKSISGIVRNTGRNLETSMLLLVSFAVGILIFSPVLGSAARSAPLTYIAYLPIMWAAIRFGPRETAMIAFLLSILAVVGTTLGYGPFVQERLSGSLLYLQSFMVTISISSILLASAIAERKILERRKDEFLSIASHELKTPITTLRAYGQFLEKKTTKSSLKEHRRFISKMNEQIERLIVLINDMLDFSKISVGKLHFHLKRVDIDKLVRKTVSDFKYMASAHEIRITGSIRRKVMADQDRIRQVIINLLTNAVKYSPESKKVNVKLRQVEGSIIVGVQDFGIGIPQEDQKHLFKRFVRIGEEKKNSATGFGLGLYISSEIIKRHQGKIWVESVEGKGSTFSFSMPIHISKPK